MNPVRNFTCFKKRIALVFLSGAVAGSSLGCSSGAAGSSSVSLLRVLKSLKFLLNFVLKLNFKCVVAIQIYSRTSNEILPVTLPIFCLCKSMNPVFVPSFWSLRRRHALHQTQKIAHFSHKLVISYSNKYLILLVILFRTFEAAHLDTLR